MKIHIFGCSLSHGIWWDRFVTNHQSVVYAVPAGDNTTQCRRFQDLVVANGISENDFVLWQVTYPGRMGFRLHPRHHFVESNGHRGEVTKNLHQTIHKNILDQEKHLDYVAFNKEWYNTFYYVENVNQELQSLLYNIKIADKITKKKTMVWFAQQDMFDHEIAQKFIGFLDVNDIDHVPLDKSIMTWAQVNKVRMDKESLHPTAISYKMFVDEILIPKIDENIRRNS
jgi:hypothetical protein